MAPSLDNATVGDAMHEGIVSCPAEAPAAKVAREMADRQVHCIFVMHGAQGESDQPYVWGIISDLDLMRAVARGAHDETAGALAAQPLVTVKPTLPLRKAASLMVERRISHLIVEEPATHHPVGVLSTADVASVFASGQA